MTHTISSETITPALVCRLVEEDAKIAIGPEAAERINRCRSYLDHKISECKEPVYGITTGFGSLCNISISADDLSQLQKNLVMSHACGVGDRVDSRIVKTMLLLKIQSLSYGNSGVQLSTVERLAYFFQRGHHSRCLSAGFTRRFRRSCTACKHVPAASRTRGSRI